MRQKALKQAIIKLSAFLWFQLISNFFRKVERLGSDTVLDWVYDNRVDELTIGLWLKIKFWSSPAESPPLGDVVSCMWQSIAGGWRAVVQATENRIPALLNSNPTGYTPTINIESSLKGTQ